MLRPDRILKALLGILKFVYTDDDSQFVGARLIQATIRASEELEEIAAITASGFYNFWSHLFNEEGYLRAVRMFDNALELDASGFDVRCLKAESFLLLGAADSAKQVYTDVLNRFGRSEHAVDVVEVLEKAVFFDPTDGDYHLLLARGHAMKQDLSSAMKSALRGINTDPNRSDSWAALSAYSDRIMAERPGLTPSAVLDEVIAPSLHDDRSLLFVARLYHHLGMHRHPGNTMAGC